MNSLIASIAIVEEDTNDDVSLVWVFPGINSETRKVCFLIYRFRAKNSNHIENVKRADSTSTVQGFGYFLIHVLQL